MFKMRPVLEYASLKVSEPRVKNVHWWTLSTGIVWKLNTDPSCPSTYVEQLSFLLINHLRNAIEPGSSLPKSLEPDAEWVFTGRYLAGEFRIKKNLEFFVCACARKGSNKPTRTRPSNNSWEESCIQEGSDNPTMI